MAAKNFLNMEGTQNKWTMAKRIRYILTFKVRRSRCNGKDQQNLTD